MQEKEQETDNEKTVNVIAEDCVADKRPWKRRALDELFPQLSFGGGKQKYSRGRSVAILFALYSSHVFSSWGDRMWQFLVTLLLALLYPGSLLLPAVFGLVVAILPALLGTFLGDFVDRNHRMRVVWVSLLVQNSLVFVCALGLAVLFGMDLGICGDFSLVLFILLTSFVILLGAVANLATVVNTIAIEKDWIVVVADKNEDILAGLNANMRRIDLVCKLLAPAVAGAILQFTGPLATTIIVASWNIISFFAELGLIWQVYRWVPALKVKKLRKYSIIESPDIPLIERQGEEEKEEDLGEKGEQITSFTEEDQDTEMPLVEKVNGHIDDNADASTTRPTRCSRLLTLYVSLKDGWSIYWEQEVALAGLALAVIYLTVLGFCGVTASYFLTQGLPNAAIGASQGIGAIFGVSGTIAYPYIRRKMGTAKTGMFGISCQLAMLMLCLVAVVVPGERVENTAEGYFSPHCPAEDDCGGPPMNSALLPTPSPSLSIYNFPPSSPTPLFSPSPTPTSFPAPSPSPTVASGEGSGDDLHRPIREAEADPGSDALITSPVPSPSPTCTTSTTSSVSDVELNRDRLVPLVLMLSGIILARFGLWIFDLAIQQRVQETVAEESRGAVGGVMNAMNSVMDMLHYILVIVAPRPEHFSILTFISVGMVSLGAMLYALYLRRTLGHSSPFQPCWQICKSRVVGPEEQGLTAKTDEINFVVDNEDVLVGTQSQC